MIVERIISPSTDNNMKALLESLDHSSTNKVTFFASATSIGNDPWISDANLPLLCALAEIDVPVLGSIYIVFDGNFLTAQRGARYSEVKVVLDKAQDSGKAFFSPVRLDRFPHSMTPEEAKDYLQAVPVEKLDPETRSKYFALLSNLTEEQIA